MDYFGLFKYLNNTLSVVASSSSYLVFVKIHLHDSWVEQMSTIFLLKNSEANME